MIFVFLLALFASTVAFPNGNIVIYGDVHKNVEFFNRTFPWIIDNVGGNLYVEYHLLGSGRYSVPQACSLRDLTSNAFLQAQYLRCEVKGYPSEYCLCEAGIDPQNFKQCVAYGGYIAGTAWEKFSELGIHFTPIIDLGSNDTVFGLDDISLLKKICTIYGDNPPRGCIHYSNQTESFLEKKALAQFDRACLKEFPIDDEKPEAETTSTPWVTPTTSDWWTTTTTTELCNTQPGDNSTTSPSWSTTPPPIFTTSPPWSTMPPPIFTTLPPWSTTPPSIFTTSPPWSTTSPPWFTTSTPATRTTPQLPTTTPRPTQPTLWPTWWPTRTTARPTWPTLWPTRATPSNPKAMNEEVTEARIPASE